VDGRLADAVVALETTASELSARLGATSEQLAGRMVRLDGHLRRLAERSVLAEKFAGAQLETLSTQWHELESDAAQIAAKSPHED
jgi:hypothetical protein